MPQQIDPNTGQPVGPAYGDLGGGGPAQFIPGLDGLPDARLAQEGEQPGAFQYFRTGPDGARYIQDARSNPNEGGAQPAMPQPGIGGAVPAPAPLPNSPQMMSGQSGGGTMPGIGGNMIQALLPFLMAMMQPGIGGFQQGAGYGQPSGGYGAPRYQPPGRFAPQPTGGISRGTFSF